MNEIVMCFPVNTLINYSDWSIEIFSIRKSQSTNQNGYTTLVKGSLWVCWPGNATHSYTTLYTMISFNILQFMSTWVYWIFIGTGAFISEIRAWFFLGSLNNRAGITLLYTILIWLFLDITHWIFSMVGKRQYDSNNSEASCSLDRILIFLITRFRRTLKKLKTL